MGFGQHPMTHAHSLVHCWYSIVYWCWVGVMASEFLVLVGCWEWFGASVDVQTSPRVVVGGESDRE